MSVRVLHGDCLQILPTLSGLDACITDPPYELAFMGREWDRSGVAFSQNTWRLVYDALKPGAHLLAFGGSRTFARMFCAIEDAGFEYRDTLMWLYGTGFPKSHDISKAIDKAAGAEREVIAPPPYTRGATEMRYSETRKVSYDCQPQPITAPATPEAQQWAGWGTALKPAFEPIGMFRKPLDGTVAANVLKHGTGAINIDACRIGTSGGTHKHDAPKHDSNGVFGNGLNGGGGKGREINAGRWPANVVHDGSDEVEAAFAAFGERPSGSLLPGHKRGSGVTSYDGGGGIVAATYGGDTGTASRFFYSAKASKADRAGSKHPTVKPLALMRWLVRLVTPPGGTVLDCFAGSGTTGEAAMLEGFNAVLIEREDEYIADINRRIERATQERTTIITTAQLDMFA